MFNPLNLEVFRLMFFCRGSLFFTTRGMCVFFVLRVKFFIPVTYFWLRVFSWDIPTPWMFSWDIPTRAQGIYEDNTRGVGISQENTHIKPIIGHSINTVTLRTKGKKCCGCC